MATLYGSLAVDQGENPKLQTKRKQTKYLKIILGVALCLGIPFVMELTTINTTSPMTFTTPPTTTSNKFRDSKPVDYFKPSHDLCKNERFLTLKDLRFCLERIPFDKKLKMNNIEQLKKIIPAYAFAEVAKAPHPFGKGFTPGFNIDKELDKISKKEYKTDIDFHNDLYNLFIHLRDAHTTYVKPHYYSTFYALQPVKLLSLEDPDGRQKIVLDLPLHEEFFVYRSLYHEENEYIEHPKTFKKWEVIEINNKPALEELKNFADNHIGLLKDDGSRFNLAVAGYGNNRGWFYFRSMHSFDAPLDDYVEYTLRNPHNISEVETIQVRWMGVNVAATFIPEQKDRFKWSKDKIKDKKFHLKGRIVSDHFLNRYKSLLYDHGFLTERRDSVTFKTYVDQSSPESSIGILKISEFSPTFMRFSYLQWLDTFGSQVSNELARFSRNNGTKLIIDLRGNGGGDICLGYALLRFLFPQRSKNGPKEAHGPHREARYHVRSSPLLSLLAHEGYRQALWKPSEATTEWSPNAWYHSDTRTQFINASWIDNKRVSSLGNISEPIYFGCGAYEDYFEAPGTCFKGLDQKNVILISDGMCGSTCAVFSSFIQMHNMGTTVVFGGFADTPQQFFGFPGGEVYRLSQIIDDAKTIGIKNNKLVPKSLSKGSDLGFTLVSIDPWIKDHSSLPLEYTFVPAHHHLLYRDSPENSEQVYQRALEAVNAPIST